LSLILYIFFDKYQVFRKGFDKDNISRKTLENSQTKPIINLVFYFLEVFALYLFSFDKYAGHDRVFLWQIKEEIFWKSKKASFQAGDLVTFGEDVFLCLGKEVSFPEIYNYAYLSTLKAKIIYKWLISPTSMQYIHRMVYQRYSSYKSVLKYFLSFDIPKLLAREIKENSSNSLDQKLYLFPDLWSLMNVVPESQQNKKGHIFLHSQMTAKQKDLARRNIKKGLIHTVFTTHSGMFQDWDNLQKITIYDPHKRYYANHQDPRYKVITCVNEMKKIYSIN